MVTRPVLSLNHCDRMRRAYHVTMTVALNMRAGLARVRMAQAFRETAEMFAGEVVRGFSMENRMTVCNMSIEAGARAGSNWERWYPP